MRSYSQLPHSVSAVMWTGTNEKEIQNHLGITNTRQVPDTKVLLIDLEDNTVTVDPSDWVCIGDDLKVYVLKNHIFVGVYHGAYEK